MNVIILISKHPSLYNHLTLCDRGRSVREHLDYLSMNINTLGFKGVQSVQVRSRLVVALRQSSASNGAVGRAMLPVAS